MATSSITRSFIFAEESIDGMLEDAISDEQSGNEVDDGATDVDNVAEKTESPSSSRSFYQRRTFFTKFYQQKENGKKSRRQQM